MDSESKVNSDEQRRLRLAEESFHELHADLIHDRHLAGECRRDGTRYPEGEPR